MKLVSRWLHGGFTEISRRFHGGFTVVSRWFHGGFTVISQWFHGGFTVISQWCSVAFTVVLRWFHGDFTVFSQWFHNCFRKKRSRLKQLAFVTFRAILDAQEFKIGKKDLILYPVKQILLFLHFSMLYAVYEKLKII